jgi:DNA polymerase-3 subunit gamma/tau
MADYQVIARKYRPKTFREVLGQDAIVTTLRNAIKFNRLAHAYLFCGSRGTGKTTLARILAKAINCLEPKEDCEPCNKCASCVAISSGSSLDVLEIDGASNRGIDDIRQINETIGYAPAFGKYKIYIIDEVHMLTKEAFNALLKTLEEPPAKVKFFFATTEPQKILPTILSRCQRYHLHRIATETIVEKLSFILEDLKVEIEKEALYLIATMAEGGLRDAESLLDQIISSYEGAITGDSVAAILGMMPRDCFFELDRAGKEGHYYKAFEIVDTVFTQGKDLAHFVEMLVDHFRHLLLIKLSGPQAPFISLSPHDKGLYEASAKLYSQEQCLTILDFLIEAQDQIRFSASPRIALEALLLKILRTHQRIPVEFLVRRLAELERQIGAAPQAAVEPIVPAVAPVALSHKEPEILRPQEKVPQSQQQQTELRLQPPVPPVMARPAPKDDPKDVSAPVELGARPTEAVKVADRKRQGQYDTLLQFAAVELEGTVQKKSITRSH